MKTTKSFKDYDKRFIKAGTEYDDVLVCGVVGKAQRYNLVKDGFVVAVIPNHDKLLEVTK